MRNWKIRLAAYVRHPDGSLDPVVVALDDQCRLGQWLQRSGASNSARAVNPRTAAASAPWALRLRQSCNPIASTRAPRIRGWPSAGFDAGADRGSRHGWWEQH
jgi:hypothetical protein